MFKFQKNIIVLYVCVRVRTCVCVYYFSIWHGCMEILLFCISNFYAPRRIRKARKWWDRRLRTDVKCSLHISSGGKHLTCDRRPQPNPYEFLLERTGFSLHTCLIPFPLPDSFSRQWFHYTFSCIINHRRNGIV